MNLKETQKIEQKEGTWLVGSVHQDQIKGNDHYYLDEEKSYIFIESEC